MIYSGVGTAMLELSVRPLIRLRFHAYSVCRLAGVLVLLLAPWSAWNQSPAWHAGVAKVTVREDLNRQAGTAFVVAVDDGKAYLVTSAHVVEADPNPQIEFVAVPRKQYKSTVRHVEGGEEHGLALLEVGKPPASVQVLQPSPRPVIGQRVTAAGFPASVGSFTAIETTVATFRGRELALGFETGAGFSGGPVLSEKGAAVGLVFGRTPGFGLAVESADVRTYLEGQGLSWGSQQQWAGESMKPIPSAERKAGEVRKNPSDGQNYVWIPPGEFRMGCSIGDVDCNDDEQPRVEVRVRDFWIGSTEVTRAAYAKTMHRASIAADGAALPQVDVTWFQADSFCRLIGGRLPTEAEWEYAARAGTTTRFPAADLSSIAWFANVRPLRPVAQRDPNAFGLYDTLGNAAEWVQDWYSREQYRNHHRGALWRPPESGEYRVIRGGNYTDPTLGLRVSLRFYQVPAVSAAHTGFRCVTEFEFHH